MDAPARLEAHYARNNIVQHSNYMKNADIYWKCKTFHLQRHFIFSVFSIFSFTVCTVDQIPTVRCHPCWLGIEKEYDD